MGVERVEYLACPTPTSTEHPMKIVLFLFFSLIVSLASAAEGLVTITSPYSVEKTADRLEKVVADAGFTLAVRWDHQKGAEKAGLKLPPEQLLIFGKPKAGTLLMQSNPTAGIDLPMKYLIWQDADGKTRVAWNDPAWIAARHHITDRAGLVAKMQGVLRKLAEKGVAP